MKLVLAVWLTVAVVSYAEQTQNSSRSQVILDKSVQIDGPIEGRPIPWITSRSAPSYNPKFYSCGTITVAGSHYPKPGSEFVVEWFNCTYSVLGINFKTRSLLVFVDLNLFSYPREGEAAKFIPYARYIAELKGEATDYLAAIYDSKETLSPMDSLAEVMSFLGRSTQGIGQKHHVDGTLTLTQKGPHKFDPLSHGFARPGDPSITFGCHGFQSLRSSEGCSSFKLDSVASDVNRYRDPKELFGALAKTQAILKSGYEDLRASSDGSEKARFRKLIVENSETIAEEIQVALGMMRKQDYHPLEIIHLVNQLSDLVAAIDGILEGKTGSAPGFVEILNSR